MKNTTINSVRLVIANLAKSTRKDKIVVMADDFNRRLATLHKAYVQGMVSPTRFDQIVSAYDELMDWFEQYANLDGVSDATFEQIRDFVLSMEPKKSVSTVKPKQEKPVETVSAKQEKTSVKPNYAYVKIGKNLVQCDYLGFADGMHSVRTSKGKTLRRKIVQFPDTMPVLVDQPTDKLELSDTESIDYDHYLAELDAIDLDLRLLACEFAMVSATIRYCEKLQSVPVEEENPVEMPDVDFSALDKLLAENAELLNENQNVIDDISRFQIEEMPKNQQTMNCLRNLPAKKVKPAKGSGISKWKQSEYEGVRASEEVPALGVIVRAATINERKLQETRTNFFDTEKGKKVLENNMNQTLQGKSVNPVLR